MSHQVKAVRLRGEEVPLPPRHTGSIGHAQILSPDLRNPEGARRLLEYLGSAEAAEMAKRFDGSLKAEHGTGRNMAPFVEKEWGAQAHGIMRRLKALLDPRGILNPGVVLNDDLLGIWGEADHVVALKKSLDRRPVAIGDAPTASGSK